ncbi:MAG: putative lipid II flippase FtsW [Bacillota bacterium]|nr:putative lipid II flippase FtsW [Bacillota bacterium]
MKKVRRKTVYKPDPPQSFDYNKAFIDLPFLIIVIVLLFAGLIVMFSASHANAYYRYGDSYYFIKKQFVFALVGIVAMAVTTNFATPKLLHKFALPTLGISIVLLALVPFIGRTINDARRWIYIGPLSIQPSEIAKIGVILSFAYMITRNQKRMKTFKYGILPYGVILGIITVLLYLEPHNSATIITITLGAILIIVGGANLGWFASFGGIAAAGIALAILGTGHGMTRIRIWLDPYVDPQGKGFQTIQSLIAVGSGGLFGLGLGKSRQKYLYIPEPQNDFVFSIAAEELGFVGAVLIVLLFALLIWRGFVIALRAPDRFSGLVVIGFTSKVALQALLNIMVVTNLVPNTGISLPFFSYGGTALVLQMAEMGIILSISRYARLVKT